MNKKTAAAGTSALLAAGAFAAAGLTGPASAGTDGDGAGPPSAQMQTKSAAKATKLCKGGAQERVYSKSSSGYFGVDDTVGGYTTLPGTPINAKATGAGKDTLVIRFTAKSYVYPDTQGRLRIMVDGAILKPGDPSYGHVYYNETGDYGTIAEQHCIRVPAGNHSVRVASAVYDYGDAGTSTFYVGDSTLTVEVSD